MRGQILRIRSTPSQALLSRTGGGNNSRLASLTHSRSILSLPAGSDISITMSNLSVSEARAKLRSHFSTFQGDSDTYGKGKQPIQIIYVWAPAN